MGVAAIAAVWGGGADAVVRVRAMMAEVPYRAPAGAETVSSRGCAVAAGGAAAVHETATGIVVAADGIHPEAAERVVAAYQRAGAGAARQLPEPLSFVLWDPGRGLLYAARDPSGTRPLYYVAASGIVAVATDVAQLAAWPGQFGGVDPRTVTDLLRRRFGDPAATFHRAIRRLPPGCQLIADAEGVRVERFWTPMFAPDAAIAPGDAARRFAAAFRAAVERAAPAGEATAVLVSGGLDSSSIACVAASTTARPRPALWSAAFPQASTDESRYVDAVARVTGIQITRAQVDGAFVDGLDGSAHPIRGASIVAAVWREAARAGATVGLSGLGGDELLFERGVLWDLLARGRLARLAGEAVRLDYIGGTRRRWLLDAVRGVTPPVARSVYRAARRRGPPEPPAWAGPIVAEAWRSPAVDPPRTWPSWTQEHTWRWLTSAHSVWNLELEEEAAARAGIDLRFPFRDTALAELVLRLPWSARAPGGPSKALLRRALGDVLPREIAERTEVTVFPDVVVDRTTARADAIGEVLGNGPWLSAPWVDRAGAQALLRDALDHRDLRAAALVWDIAYLEQWLRDR